MEKRGKENQHSVAEGEDAGARLNGAGALAAGGVATVGTASGEPELRLHDRELHSRLDAAFADHFRVHRKCSAWVRFNHLLKRVFDIAFLLVGIVVAVPLIAAASLATLLDTGRPIFYVQTRRVRFGRVARIYKMRTLLVGSDRDLGALVSVKHHGKFLNVKKDHTRYTRVAWLERLWIVELPQLLNIARGQMSVVGNRPIPDYVINALGPTAEVIERFASPQGLTGYVQSIGRDDVSDNERVLLEYHYSDVYERGNVFFEDLKIILYTAAAYFGKQITVAHFLGDDYMTRYRTFFASCGVEGSDLSETTTVEVKHRLACPTCRVKANGSADYPRLDDSLACPSCGTTYEERRGVVDLFPRSEESRDNPYIEYYENEYLDQNPEMHLEDTDWKIREMLPLLRRTRDRHRSILDVGCGAGEILKRVGDAVGSRDRTAADCSRRILEFAKKRHPEATHIRVDASQLPFCDGSYDLSMLIDVIEHQADPERVLRELSRISKRMLLRTPLEDCWYERLRRRSRDLFMESRGHVVHFNPRSVRRMLERNGFEIKEEAIEHIEWAHWKRVLGEGLPLHGRLTVLARMGLRIILPNFLYRRLFVMNYNVLCESTHHVEAPAGDGR